MVMQKGDAAVAEAEAGLREKRNSSNASSTAADPQRTDLPVYEVRTEGGSGPNGAVADDGTGNGTGAADTPGPLRFLRQPSSVTMAETKRFFRVRTAGESHRSGFHPGHFLRIAFRSSSKVSSAVNVLWPAVPAALAVRYARPDLTLVVFTLTYVAMVPCANLIGFAGQELARKVPHVFGVLTETTLGSIVEVIMFMVLLVRPVDEVKVIQAAILGSILATMLLCLGLCFFIGGLRREEQEFQEAVSEAGNGLLLTAGFGLAVPTLFLRSLSGETSLTAAELSERVLALSRVSSVLLIIAYIIFLWFQTRTHHGIYDAIFMADEERREEMRHRSCATTHGEGNSDAAAACFAPSPKLTLTECIVALAVSLPLVTLLAIILVDEIPTIVAERGVSEAFMGLILVPLVEKAAEHLTAIDEAWNNQMNFALSHVLGATLQTALFNAPLAVIVGWGLGRDMDLSFELFDIAVLILTIITVGQFLRDQKSNYLEGALCVTVYVAVAVAAAYYPATVQPGAAGDAGNEAARR